MIEMGKKRGPIAPPVEAMPRAIPRRRMNHLGRMVCVSMPPAPREPAAPTTPKKR